MDKDEQLKEQYDTLIEYEQKLNEFNVNEEKIARQLEMERDWRAQDTEHFRNEVKDLQEQIAEYEEETMSLQNQLYQAKL